MTVGNHFLFISCVYISCLCSTATPVEVGVRLHVGLNSLLHVMSFMRTHAMSKAAQLQESSTPGICPMHAVLDGCSL